MLLSYNPTLEDKIVQLLGASPHQRVPEIHAKIGAESVSIPGLYRTLRDLRERGIVIRSSATFALSPSWLRELAAWTVSVSAQHEKIAIQGGRVLRSIEALTEAIFENMYLYAQSARPSAIYVVERLPILSLCGQAPYARLMRVLAGMECVVHRINSSAEAERTCRRYGRGDAVPVLVVLIARRALIVSCNQELERELALGEITAATVRRIRNSDVRLSFRSIDIRSEIDPARLVQSPDNLGKVDSKKREV